MSQSINNEVLKNLSILYVEDEADVRRNAVEFLKRICKTVYEASNGKEAIAIWQDEKPDIIITDISMPKLNGIDMARYIRAEDHETQIIVATAHTKTDYLLEAVELQLVKYLVKPITKEKLIGALNQTLSLIEDKSKFSVSLSETMSYNAFTQSLSDGANEVKLTKNENLFVNLLSSNHSRVVKYEEIENAIWPYDGMSQDAIRSLVRGLRKKLPDNAIDNISGSGYKINIL